MALTTSDELADWAAGTERAGFRRRNWSVVRQLTASTAVLLLASLPAEFILGSRTLTATCWIGAAMTGSAMFTWFRDSRRFVERPPSQR